MVSMQYFKLEKIGLLLFLLLLSPLQAHSTPLKIDKANSTIQIDVKATAGSFVGNLERFKLAIEVNEAAQAIQSATLEFDFEYLETNEPKRNRHMKDWMNYDEYPKAKFKLTTLDATGEQTLAKGSLTIHGIKKDISFPVEISQDGDRWTIDGKAHLDYLVFGLKKIRMALMLTVNPEFDVLIHIEGVAVKEEAIKKKKDKAVKSEPKEAL